MESRNGHFTTSHTPISAPLATIKNNAKNAIFNNKRMIKWARNHQNNKLKTQGNSSKPSPDPNREKMEFFVFLRNTPFLDRLNEHGSEWPKMASKNPRNGPHMLKTLEIFDFQHKII